MFLCVCVCTCECECVRACLHVCVCVCVCVCTIIKQTIPRTRSVDAHGVRSGIAFSTYNVYTVWAYAMYTYNVHVSFITHLFYPVILSWFVDKPVVQSALKGALIEEENVECRPEKANAVLDENVNMCLVRKYFSQGTWMLVEDGKIRFGYLSA